MDSKALSPKWCHYCQKDNHNDAECHSTRTCTCGQYPHLPRCGLPATWCVHCGEGVASVCRSRCATRVCPQGLPHTSVLRALQTLKDRP